MRYSDTHKQETRDRVLAVAARTLRARGPERLGVAEVMAEAGLTHGGFYAHFKSKDDLLAAAVEEAFKDGRALWRTATEDRPGVEGLARYIELYVSGQHRDRIDTGCPVAALNTDFARTESVAGDTFRANVARLLGVIAERLPGDDPQVRAAEAGAIFGQMMGAVLVARTMADREASNRLLAATRDSLTARIRA